MKAHVQWNHGHEMRRRRHVTRLSILGFILVSRKSAPCRHVNAAVCAHLRVLPRPVSRHPQLVDYHTAAGAGVS
jgi:hypothetical protein